MVALPLSRRAFVKTGSLWVLAGAGCGRAASGNGEAPRDASAPPSLPAAPAGPPARPAAPPAVSQAAVGCAATEDNIEGPYYRPGAPPRAELADGSTPGTRLVIRGRVFGADCRTPLAGATLDVWQADGEGRYDNDGHRGAPDARLFTLRGKLLTDEAGRYEMRSVVPGHYLNGRQYRPAHVHVKLSAPGHAPLTTQLYFEGDPYNSIDPFLHRSLIMAVKPADGGAETTFDFALARR